MADKNSNTNLTLPRSEVSEKINRQIEAGTTLRDREIASSHELNDAQREQERWKSFTIELLRRSFDSPSYAESFERTNINRLIRTQAPLQARIQHFREALGLKINNLQGLLDSLPLIPEAQIDIEPDIRSTSEAEVFIVHGHDLAVLNELARFIEKIGLKPIILSEQPSQGRTIIEKFEHYGAVVGFAVVLLTPDDVIAPQNATGDVLTQARPNVLFELGYFAGKLGRGRVCLLRKDPTDIPSDLFGLVYISLDKSNWQVELAREMSAVGLPIDLNRLV